MATRLYLSGGPGQGSDIDPGNTGVGPFSGSLISTFVRQRVVRPAVGKRNLPFVSIGTALTWTGVNDSAVFFQWVGDELQAGTLAGTVKGQIRAMVNNAAGNIRLNYAFGLCAQDGSNRRTIIQGNETNTTHLLTTTMTNRKVFFDGPVTIPSTTINANDRPWLLLGPFKSGTDGTYTTTVDTGDPIGIGDLPEDETSTTQLCPWIETSQDLAFVSDTPIMRDTWPLVRGGLYLRMGFPGTLETKFTGTGVGAVTDQYNQVADGLFDESSVGEYKTRSGDESSPGTGERALHTWDESREDRLDGGGERWYAFSTKFLSPWTNPATFSVFYEQHDNRAGNTQAPIKFMTAQSHDADNATAKLWLYLNTGRDTDGNGNTTYDQGHLLIDHLDLDVRHDWVMRVKYDSNLVNNGAASGASGEIDVFHRLSTESKFTRVKQLRNIPTLQSYAGSLDTVKTLVGFYRNPSAWTNTVRIGSFRAGPTAASILTPTVGGTAWPDPTAATNLVGNPSFETDLAGWTKQDNTTLSTLTASRDTTVSKFGSASLKLDQATAGEDDWEQFQVTGLTGGSTYTLSAWLNCTAFTGAALGNRALMAYDEVGVAVNSELTAATSGWVRHSRSITLSPAANRTTIRLYAPKGTIYWDGIQLELGATATPYTDAAITAIASTVSAPLESPAGIAKTSTTAVESTPSLVTATSVAPFEALGVASRTLAAPLEALTPGAASGPFYSSASLTRLRVWTSIGGSTHEFNVALPYTAQNDEEEWLLDQLLESYPALTKT